MKKYLTAAFLASVFFLSAGEREDLLQSFQRETAVAWQKFQAAETTVDLTAAAGNCYHTASVQVLKALDYKLRHTASSTKRLKLLKDFQDLSCEAERVLNTPRENMGSSGAMHISNAAANLFQQHTAVLLLKGQDEIRWKELENALAVRNAEYQTLEQRFTEMTQNYNNLKQAKVISLSDAEIGATRNRLTELVREIDQCIESLTK